MRVKICCIQDVAELRTAMRAGVHAVGLVGRMPSGPGPIPDTRIREIAVQVPPGISTFLLTCETTAEGIIAHHSRTHTDTLQLVDHVDAHVYPLLRAALPGVRIVQVIHVLDQRSIEQAQAAAGYADALLLDSGNPHALVKTLGGTGNTHDWSLSRQIVDTVPIPVFLAGGLNPDNVRKAIDAVQPYGVDVCSGLRTNGVLDPAQCAAFFEAVYR